MMYALLPLWLFQVWLAYKVYGWTVAYFQGSFPRIAAEHEREDRGFGVVWAAFTLVPGIGFLIAGLIYCMSGFAKYGWRA